MLFFYMAWDTGFPLGEGGFPLEEWGSGGHFVPKSGGGMLPKISKIMMCMPYIGY